MHFERQTQRVSHHVVLGFETQDMPPRWWEACRAQCSKGSSSQCGDWWWENEWEKQRVLQACPGGREEENVVIEGNFRRINNQGFNITTKEQTKTLMTCTYNKRRSLDDNVHTLAFRHYRRKTCIEKVVYTLDSLVRESEIPVSDVKVTILVWIDAGEWIIPR